MPSREDGFNIYSQGTVDKKRTNYYKHKSKTKPRLNVPFYLQGIPFPLQSAENTKQDFAFLTEAPCFGLQHQDTQAFCSEDIVSGFQMEHIPQQPVVDLCIISVLVSI